MGEELAIQPPVKKLLFDFRVSVTVRKKLGGSVRKKSCSQLRFYHRIAPQAQSAVRHKLNLRLSNRHPQ